MADEVPGRGRVAAAGAVIFYAALSVFCWHYLIGAGISTHMYQVTQVGDVGQGIWFMGWLPYAIGHGLNPLVSDFMFAPHGINLLTNTNFFPEALLLSPVTELFSPLVSFNVACMAAPVVSACAMYFVLRRLEFGRGTAFVGGLLYGFSPSIMQADRIGHFNLTWMFFPPLLLLLLERLLLKQQGSPIRYGLALGALVVVQFFNSPEILIDCVVVAVPAVVVLAAVRFKEVPSHLRFALTGGGVALAVAALLLAYPVWYYITGPDHVSHLLGGASPGAALVSPVWPALGTGKSFLVEPPGTPLLRRFDQAFIGPVLLLALSSLFFARRRRSAVLLLGTALLCFVLSWGTHAHTIGTSAGFGWHAPAYYLERAIPILRNLDWIRISILTDLLVVVAAALATKEIAALMRERSRDGRQEGHVATAGGLAAAAMAVPLFVAGGVPFAPIDSVVAPPVLQHIPAAGDGSPPVALVYPVAGVFNGRTLAWQSIAGFTWRDWAGYAWHPKPGTRGAGYVDPDVSEVLYLTAFADRTSPAIVLSALQRRQIVAGMGQLGISYVVVVAGSPGSQQMTRMLTQVYGTPKRYGSGSIWRTSP